MKVVFVLHMRLRLEYVFFGKTFSTSVSAFPHSGRGGSPITKLPKLPWYYTVSQEQFSNLPSTSNRGK